jgi:citronellyl-CoA dehydrogenase
MAEYEVSRAWRDTRLITIGGGTSEIMREILAKVHGLGK